MAKKDKDMSKMSFDSEDEAKKYVDDHLKKDKSKKFNITQKGDKWVVAMVEETTEATNPHFGMTWDQKTGRFFPALGNTSKVRTNGTNKGRFEGPLGLTHKKNPNFTCENVDDLIDKVADGADPKEAMKNTDVQESRMEGIRLDPTSFKNVTKFESDLFNQNYTAAGILVTPAGEETPTPWDADLSVAGGKLVLKGSVGPGGSGYCECRVPLAKAKFYWMFELQEDSDEVFELMAKHGIKSL